MPEPQTGGAANATSAAVGHGSFALGIVESAAAGDYKDVAIQTGMKIAFTPATYEAAAQLAADVAPVAKALSFIGKNLPIIGGILLAATDAKEVYDHLKTGDYKGAALAAAAGAVEVAATTAGGALGGVAGALAREAIVKGSEMAGGPKLNHSGLYTVAEGAIKLGEKGYAAGSKYVAALSHDPAKIEAEQAALLHKEGVLPKTVKFGGREVPLETALRNPTFNKDFRENLENSQKNGHLDAKPLLAQLDHFDALEKQRVTLVAAEKSNAPAQTASRAPTAPAAAHA